METKAEYVTEHRDRTVLNKGLAELKTIIPELDEDERAMLVGILGNALLELVGTYANFYASHDGQLYQANFLARPIVLELDVTELGFSLDNPPQSGV